MAGHGRYYPFRVRAGMAASAAFPSLGRLVLNNRVINLYRSSGRWALLASALCA